MWFPNGLQSSRGNLVLQTTSTDVLTSPFSSRPHFPRLSYPETLSWDQNARLIFEAQNKVSHHEKIQLKKKNMQKTHLWHLDLRTATCRWLFSSHPAIGSALHELGICLSKLY